jgi:hypothetical protein
MPNFPPPPTYADPIIVDEITRRSQFNPLWFKWFLDLGDFVTKNGGGGLIQHNNLGALQGGSANEYYHLTTSQHGALTAGFTGTGVLVRQTAPAITNPTITQGRATQLDYTGYSLTPVGVPATVGTLSWDDGNGTLQLTLKNGNITYTIGQQEYAYCYNDSGTALTKGQVVYISGAQGNRIAVKLAQGNSDPNSAHTIGFVAESITAGAEGWVQSSGPIYKLNTLGYTAGATVYLSPTTPGGWTTTRPSAPNHTVILGFIERVSATVGSIYIKVDNGYELDELHNVKITSVANNDLLQYDSTGPFWKNVAQSSLAAGTTTNLAAGSSGALPYQTGPGATTFLGIGAANRVLTSTGSVPQWSTALSGLTSVVSTGNITCRSMTVHPVLSGKLANNDLTVQNTSGALCSIGMYAPGTGSTIVASIVFVTNGDYLRGGISCVEESGGTPAYLSFATRDNLNVYAERVRIGSSGVVTVQNLTASQAVFTNASKQLVSTPITGTGSVVMGTSPTITTPTFTTSATAPLVIGGTGTTSSLTLRSTSGAGTTGADIIFQTGNNGSTEAMRVLNNGNVGIGTNAPSTRLQVSGTASQAPAALITSAQTGTTVRSNSVFRLQSEATGRDVYMQFSDNVTNSTEIGMVGGATYFCTAGTERMRIDAAGNVLVTNPAGLGYGTGSGGAVTQTTSRTTGVTIDRTNGAITLVSAMGTTAWQSFLVTNSKVAATDTVIVNQKSGADDYIIQVAGVAAGAFKILFATTGGTTTEQPVFNFAIIKAVTS